MSEDPAFSKAEATHYMNEDNTSARVLHPEIHACHIRESLTRHFARRTRANPETRYISDISGLADIVILGVKEGEVNVKIRGNRYSVVELADGSHLAVPCGWAGDSHYLGKDKEEGMQNLLLLLEPDFMKAALLSDSSEEYFGLTQKD